MNEVRALIDDQLFTNWTQYSVGADFEQPCAAFTLVVANPTAGQVATILEGSRITLEVGAERILSGFIDTKSLSISSAGSEMTLSGRDHAAPLVDCSLLPEQRFSNISLARLAERLLSDLAVRATVSTNADEAEAPIANVKPEPGERPWGLLARLAAQVRLRVWTVPGGIMIGRPDYTSAPVGTLQHRRDERRDVNNILRIDHEWSISRRRDPVVVIARAGGRAGSDGGGVRVQVRDTYMQGIDMRRPLVIEDGDSTTVNEARARGNYELSDRQGRAWRAVVTVVGHGPTPTKLWAPNQVVVLDDDQAGESGPVWIQSVDFSRSRTSGTTSTLNLRTLGSLLPPLE